MTEFEELVDALSEQTRAHIDKRLATERATHAAEMADVRLKLAAALTPDDVERRMSPLLARIAELEARQPIPGPEGKRGNDGAHGKDGAPGINGKDGTPGVNGNDGRDGAPGVAGKDAIVDYDRMGDMIAVAVEKQVAKYPVPRDGRDGKDGKDGVDGKDGAAGLNGKDGRDGVHGKDGANGKDVDRDELVRDVVARIPPPLNGKDGRDGVDGKDGAPGLNGKDGAAGLNGKDGAAGINGKDGSPGSNGERGLPGKDADESAIVTKILAAIPKPENGRDGRDGKDGKDASEDAIVTRVLALIPKPKDGIDGKSVDRDSVVELVRSAVHEAVEQIPPPRDGRDGVGLRGEPGENGIDGKDGRDGWSPEDLQVELRDERLLVVRLVRGSRVIERQVRLALPIYRGLYKRGSHQKGDIFTFGGSSFIALRDTDAPIGGDTPSPDWQLMSKRGRDAS